MNKTLINYLLIFLLLDIPFHQNYFHIVTSSGLYINLSWTKIDTTSMKLSALIRISFSELQGILCSHCSWTELEFCLWSTEQQVEETMWLDLNRIRRILVAHVCACVCVCMFVHAYACLLPVSTSGGASLGILYSWFLSLPAWRLGLANNSNSRNNCNCRTALLTVSSY